jgi:hypothetical protein
MRRYNRPSLPSRFGRKRFIFYNVIKPNGQIVSKDFRSFDDAFDYIEKYRDTMEGKWFISRNGTKVFSTYSYYEPEPGISNDYSRYRRR